MKWQEIEYFLERLDLTKNTNILDIGCGNGRFLQALKEVFPDILAQNYMWIDLSSWLLEEAKTLHPDFEKQFCGLNMLDIDSPLLTREGLKGWNNIFFIASFHHLDTLQDREEVLQKAFDLLTEWGKIYMTNWALNSPLNYDKYKTSLIELPWWKNKWGSLDYNITIWENDRYYHCFSIAELEYLACVSWLKVIENRLFDNQRNIITILQK